jgi:hypothetical protein
LEKSKPKGRPRLPGKLLEDKFWTRDPTAEDCADFCDNKLCYDLGNYVFANNLLPVVGPRAVDHGQTSQTNNPFASIGNLIFDS